MPVAPGWRLRVCGVGSDVGLGGGLGGDDGVRAPFVFSGLTTIRRGNGATGMNTLKRAAAALVLLAASALSTVAVGEPAAATGGLRLGGYDPVAYFADGASRQGVPEHAAAYEGAVYYFATRDHRRMFLQSPETYAPQYDGWCSYGVRVGQKFEADPTVWRIVDGRLFVQLDPGTRAVWMLDERRNISVADKVWPQLRSLRASD